MSDYSKHKYINLHRWAINNTVVNLQLNIHTYYPDHSAHKQQLTLGDDLKQQLTLDDDTKWKLTLGDNLKQQLTLDDSNWLQFYNLFANAGFVTCIEEWDKGLLSFPGLMQLLCVQQKVTV